MKIKKRRQHRPKRAKARWMHKRYRGTQENRHRTLRHTAAEIATDVENEGGRA